MKEMFNQMCETIRARFASNPQLQQPVTKRTQGLTALTIVFLLDATDSMGNVIRAVLEALSGFLDILVQGRFAPKVGLIIFRDELLGEKPEIYPVGTSMETLKAVLARTTAQGGGDIPESSLPAIMHGIRLTQEVRQEPGPKLLVLITDTRPHDPENHLTSRDVLEAIQQEKVKLFACCPAIEPYKTFVDATRGVLFELKTNITVEDFKIVLRDVAHMTVKTVRAALPISDEVRALVNNTNLKG